MHRYFVAAFVLGLIIVAAGYSADGKTPPAGLSRKSCDEVLGQVAKGDIPATMSILDKSMANPPSDADREQLRALLTVQLEVHRRNLGEPVGYECCQVKKARESMQRCLYLMKYERGAVLWTFTLYRPRDEWKIQAFHFAESIEPLFQ